MLLRRTFSSLALVFCLGAAYGQAPSLELLGRWQYLQTPDLEGEVLDLTLSAGSYQGIMNGLERAGEHGLFYYVVEVQNLAVTPDGTISFVVGERTFFTKRPPLSVLGAKGDGGMSRATMRFEGKIEGSALLLRCHGSGGSCPDKQLRFARLAAAQGPPATTPVPERAPQSPR